MKVWLKLWVEDDVISFNCVQNGSIDFTVIMRERRRLDKLMKQMSSSSRQWREKDSRASNVSTALRQHTSAVTLRSHLYLSSFWWNISSKLIIFFSLQTLWGWQYKKWDDLEREREREREREGGLERRNKDRQQWWLVVTLRWYSGLTLGHTHSAGQNMDM